MNRHFLVGLLLKHAFAVCMTAISSDVGLHVWDLVSFCIEINVLHHIGERFAFAIKIESTYIRALCLIEATEYFLMRNDSAL